MNKNINEEYSFTTINENGMEVICDTLAVINQENDNPIIIYTDYTLDKDKKFNLYVSKVIKNNDNFQLETIDDYQIIPEINQALQKIWNDMK